MDTIYKDQYGDGHETFRAIRHSIIGISVDFALVFDDRVESWAEFFNGRFKELLIPHFLKISKLANEGDYSAIIAEDQNFIEELEGQSASRLVEAAAAASDSEHRVHNRRTEKQPHGNPGRVRAGELGFKSSHEQKL